MKQEDVIARKSEIEEWIQSRTPKAEIARRLGCEIKFLNRCLQTMGFDYHGNQGGGKKNFKTRGDYVPFEIYSQQSNVQTTKLRKKLLKEGLRQYACERCGNTEWQGVPIPLEVHHLDGDKRNNKINNLQLLCPNCHALTDTYRGRNVRKHKQR